MSEIKPCPFCGGEASLHTEACPDGGGTYWNVKCRECGASSLGRYISHGNECPLGFQEIRDQWNVRHIEITDEMVERYYLKKPRIAASESPGKLTPWGEVEEYIKSAHREEMRVVMEAINEN